MVREKKSEKLEDLELSDAELISANFSAITATVTNLGDTLGVLVQKVENMAYHIIAVEEVLAEVASSTGIDLARVNGMIRAKIAGGTSGLGDSSKAIDVAAAIASAAQKK